MSTLFLDANTHLSYVCMSVCVFALRRPFNYVKKDFQFCCGEGIMMKIYPFRWKTAFPIGMTFANEKKNNPIFELFFLNGEEKKEKVFFFWLGRTGSACEQGKEFCFFFFLSFIQIPLNWFSIQGILLSSSTLTGAETSFQSSTK